MSLGLLVRQLQIVRLRLRYVTKTAVSEDLWVAMSYDVFSV